MGLILDKNQKATYIRNSIPYVIVWNSNLDYFILNKENFFLYTKYQEDDVDEHLKKGYPKNIVGKEFLYDDSCPAYENNKFFTKMCKKFTDTVINNRLKRCMNGRITQDMYISLF